MNNKESQENKVPEAALCATYDAERYAVDAEYKEKTDDELKKLVGFIDDGVKSKEPYDKIIKLTPEVKDVSKLLVDYSNSKKDFSIILNNIANLEPIEKPISSKPKASGLVGRIDKFQNYNEEVYVRIALNDCKIRILMAQYEQIDSYFYSILSAMDKADDPTAEHTAFSHTYETNRFLTSVSMKGYKPLGGAVPSYENILTLFETIDEIKSENKLYRHILKENGKKYE
jgi:hypothetical protein